MANNIKEFLQESIFDLNQGQQAQDQQQQKSTTNDAVADARQKNNSPSGLDRNNARTLTQKMRGVPVGKQVDVNAQQPMNIQGTDQKNLATVIKNDSDDLILAYEDESGACVLACVNKRKNTIYEVVLLQRNAQFLKRFMTRF